jgi:SAM-dependent methyltransferase
MIYRNEANGSGRLGPIIDRLFLDCYATEAVRNRRGLLADEISKTLAMKAPDTAKVMTLACGPARELWDIYQTLDDKSRLKATLLDIDWQALAFVADWRDKNKLQNQIELLNENLIFLSLGRRTINVPPQDLVYSIGLIDYFEDKIVTKLLNFVHSILAPGGRVILGNFHPRNQSKPFQDHIFDWALIHRTEADMDRLFQNSAFQRPSSNIRFEECGINLFAECIKE